MAYQRPSRSARRGSGRESHVYSGSPLATYSNPEPQTRFCTSVNSTNISRHRESGAVHVSYHQNGYNENSESDGESHDYFPHQRDQYTLASRHDVHRSWQQVNPYINRVLDDPSLREAIDMIEGRGSQHNRSSSRQSRPTPTHRHRSPDQYHNSRPLGYSNLRNLNENRSPQRPTERRLREDQRNGPYDAVQSVSQRSDYDRRGRHASQDRNGGYRRQYEDEYEYE